MTSRLIGWDFSSKGQSGVLQITWPLDCWVKDCSATRISSWSIIGHHSLPIGCFIVMGSFTPLQRCSWCILLPQVTMWVNILRLFQIILLSYSHVLTLFLKITLISAKKNPFHLVEDSCMGMLFIFNLNYRKLRQTNRTAKIF